MKSPRRYTSVFYGVAWHAPSGRWRVRIRVGPSAFSLGYFPFEKEELAAQVYDNAVWWLQDLRLNRARLNFPDYRPLPGLAGMLYRVREIRAILLDCGYEPHAALYPDFTAPPAAEVLAWLPKKFRFG